MECRYFGECGSCKLFNISYKDQFRLKIDRFKKLFKEFGVENIELFSSKESHFRARAEFRIFHDEKIFYAMHSLKDKRLIKIDDCKIVSRPIYNLMPKLLKEIEKSLILNEKLFRVEFLTSQTNEILVTLIYHKRLDEEWIKRAKELQELFSIFIIGRSRGQKEVLGRDFIIEELKIFDRKYRLIQSEGGFTQPNPSVNQKMIEWAKENSKEFRGDLLELYCGSGNFTIPLSENFNKILATEISKNSIKVALKNCKINNILNIKFVRLSSEEFADAFNKKRVFKRLKDANIDLDCYNFTTIFVDPPRAGLDEKSREILKNFENIIYISCNPQTLYRDLKEITKSHKIEKFALFDQFPYTHHLESGVILKKC